MQVSPGPGAIEEGTSCSAPIPITKTPRSISARRTIRGLVRRGIGEIGSIRNGRARHGFGGAAQRIPKETGPGRLLVDLGPRVCFGARGSGAGIYQLATTS